MTIRRRSLALTPRSPPNKVLIFLRSNVSGLQILFPRPPPKMPSRNDQKVNEVNRSLRVKTRNKGVETSNLNTINPGKQKQQ